MRFEFDNTITFVERMDMNIFPNKKFPDEPRIQRLSGIYPQRQAGKWMQRVIIHGGMLSASQWKSLSDIATEYTPGTPLHLTTRQNLEIHNLTKAAVPAVQKVLVQNNMTGLGACGDTLRNITLCTCSGVLNGSVALQELSSFVKTELQKLEIIHSLPRKFKIAFNCSNSCGQSWINDLAFIVAEKANKIGFRVIGGGSLGAVPATGIEIFDWIHPNDVLPVALATIDLFNDLGDRNNRRKARLRHVRQKLGDDAFIDLLNKKVNTVKRSSSFPEITLSKAKTQFAASIALRFTSGNISAAAACDMAKLAGNNNIRLRIANHHKILVYGTDETGLSAAIANHSHLAEPASRRVSFVTCPGNRWCSQGLVDTDKARELLDTALSDIVPENTTICISGCPNDCGHGRIADIGLKGCILTVDGKKKQAFNIFTGGGMGRNADLAKSLVNKKVAINDIANTVNNYLKTK